MKYWCRILVLLPAMCFATVWYVHPDSSLNSIQTALESCVDNDIVLVGPGTYYENITWPNTQGICLVSELGSDVTRIHGAGRCVISCLTNIDTMTMIRGFTIEYGSGLFNAGGIECYSASPRIADNIIQYNIGAAIGNGGGISCHGGASPLIYNNHFLYNDADGDGDGIYADYRCYPTITDNIFYWNCGIHNDIAIWCNDSTWIHGNMISGSDQGIVCYGNSAITSNTITDISWGIWAHSSVIIDSNAIDARNFGITGGELISNNTISGAQWYGISCLTGRTVHIVNCEISGCSIGVVIHGGSVFIDTCTIMNNLYGIYCVAESLPSTIEVHNNRIMNNTSYGAFNEDEHSYFNAEYNWWGDSTGPYHPDSNPGGLGDTVSDYVDFIPWLYWPGINDRPSHNPISYNNIINATILTGPIPLPTDKPHKIFDIIGRQIHTLDPAPGIYFIEVDGKIRQKVVKVR